MRSEWRVTIKSNSYTIKNGPNNIGLHKSNDIMIDTAKSVHAIIRRNDEKDGILLENMV